MALQECHKIGAPFQLKKMRTFSPVLSECISWCQLHCNHQKPIMILAFVLIALTPRMVMLMAISLCFLSGSLDSTNYTIKFQFFSQTILYCIQENSLPTKAKPTHR